MWEYQCSNGHLVVGVDPKSCPECTPASARPELWRTDPYVIYITDMAEARGLLRGLEMSTVQVGLLMAHRVRQSDARDSDQLEEFERSLYVSDPRRYGEYRQRKLQEEQDDEEGVEWRVPANIQEAHDMAKELARIEQTVRHSRAIPEPVGSDTWELTPDELQMLGD